MYGAGAGPVGDEPPANVGAAAQSRGLGPRLASRYLPSPFAMAGLYFIGALVCLGLLILASTLFDEPDGRGAVTAVLRFGALFACFGFVGALTAAIAILVRGAQSYHVYAGGFAHRRNSRVRALGWPEVSELRPIVNKRGDAAGKVQSYQLVPHQGAPVAIPLVIENGRDEFMDRLIAALQQAGVPVK
jgi:hypothetical protein